MCLLNNRTTGGEINIGGPKKQKGFWSTSTIKFLIS